jgi:hypothetical protein
VDIPVISRLYFTRALLTTSGCALDLIIPFLLYFKFDLILCQGQLWRLVTVCVFFGVFLINFLFHMYLLVSCTRVYWVTGRRGGCRRRHTQSLTPLLGLDLCALARCATDACLRRGTSAGGPPTTSPCSCLVSRA